SFKLVNNYGPTENTAVATSGEVEISEARREPSIGRPIDNAQVHILDRKLGAVPIGVAGEIYIGGAGLARGYLNRADLTAERFVPSPYASGERLYRTGDWGRWRRDGEVEYVGRMDQQVKVRGFRIELGEVEAALVREAEIAEAVVVVREGASGEKRLVAYVVAAAGAISPGTEDLRRQLAAGLPDYMIPT